ncbi:WD40-repeat-containing domain protein [Pisolithus orientalis]|uniref:WD40-repeat-containing domain protein n=1 Tax=Pisolithus orientalis TaxID=936130 RepID=UPI002224BEF9|nr:WD40-repeat-containing domain protein [Pisolithus orientalis]KAI6006260.1 WD40-repeat-containing domain protein [Pisolithus orientalis]
MLSTLYIWDKSLRGHTDTVNCLAFSSQVSYLASGSDDHLLMVWHVSSGEVACIIHTSVLILSILWDPCQCSTIIFGCDNRVAAVLSEFSGNGTFTFFFHAVLLGVKALVYCLDLDPSSGKLTLGVGPEIHITKPIAHISGSDNADDECSVHTCSLHFLMGGNKVIASYLNHGIVCWDIETHAKLWQIKPGHTHHHIRFSALSPDQQGLLVSNLSTGADLYHLGQSTQIQMYPQAPDVEQNYPLSISFLHNGNAIICGVTKGDVFIHETWTAEHQQMLEHDGDFIQVLCTGQYRQMGYIATVTAEMGSNTYIKIWSTHLCK